ncbi:2OG-Fe dioxygenase family protein [Streptomyces sp. NPDC049099]|uniref:2OG-Fe dioxygenase family protein n=1 Tax=Streptomyces sp. NPDC049099 TaxID=3155768 RepID=UPI0034300AF5
MTTTPLRAPTPPTAPARTDSPDRGAGFPEAPFLHLPPAFVEEALGAVPREAAQRFTDSWNDLPADAYLGTDNPYRYRRYNAFRCTGTDLERLPQRPFIQDRAVNGLVGGVPRTFAPLHPDVAEGAALRAVVRAFRGLLPAGDREAVDTCGVHQIRVVARTDAAGDPAPEGIHQDGHHYVGQVLIRREGVLGAESRLYDLDRRQIHQARLTEPFESILLDDRRVFHDVSPVTASPGAGTGVRDMLLIDFFSRTEPTKGTSRD